MNDTVLYELAGVAREFVGPIERIRILQRVNLRIESGQSLAILGASGSGKTTLLHILGTLDAATEGSVLFQGRDLTTLNSRERSFVRNREIGFIFQFHHLLPEFTTIENVAMPAIISGEDSAKAMAMASTALDQVGLSDRKDHRVTTLSGGERQRAAIARAILLGPKVLLADEPTGNLDETTGERIEALLVRLNRELGMTLVVVTHNKKLADGMMRRMELKSGELHDLV